MQHNEVASLVIRAANLECFALQHDGSEATCYLEMLSTLTSHVDRLLNPSLWLFVKINATFGVCSNIVPNHPESYALSLLRFYLQLRKETSKVTSACRHICIIILT